MKIILDVKIIDLCKKTNQEITREIVTDGERNLAISALEVIMDRGYEEAHESVWISSRSDEFYSRFSFDIIRRG